MPKLNTMQKVAALHKFWNFCVDHFRHGGNLELDGCDFEEKAEELNLIKWEEYNPEKHGELDCSPGDKVWLTNLE